MRKDYGGVVWTNHALARLRERGVSQGDAWATWRRPDKSRYAASRGGWVYQRNLGNQVIEVVAKKNATGEWVILSVWSRSGKHFGARKTKSLFDSVLELFALR